MGILTGKISGVFYRTEALDLSSQGAQALLQERRLELERRSFRPINKNRTETGAVGWVKIDDILDTNFKDPAFVNSVLFGDMVSPVVVLALREDRVTVNKKMLAARIKRELRAFRRENGREPSKEDRLVIEDDVRHQLYLEAQPQTSVHEMAWDVASGLVYFSSAGERLGMIFIEMFRESFERHLEPTGPAHEALAVLGEARAGELDEAEPSELVEGLAGTIEPDDGEGDNDDDSNDEEGEEDENYED